MLRRFVDKERLLGHKSVLLDDVPEALHLRFANMQQLREIGTLETLGEEVVTELLAHLPREELVIELVGIAVQIEVVALPHPSEQLLVRLRKAYEDSVPRVVNLPVGQRDVGQTAHVCAELGHGDKPLLKAVHHIRLFLFGINLLEVGNPATGKGLRNVLVADVIQHASKIEYDVLNHCSFIGKNLFTNTLQSYHLPKILL